MESILDTGSSQHFLNRCSATMQASYLKSETCLTEIEHLRGHP